MARAVYSSLLYELEGVDAPETDVVLPQGGIRYIVRFVACYCNTSPFDGQGITIASSLTNVTFAFFNWGLGERAAKLWDGRKVIDGDTGDDPGFVIKLDNTVSPVDVSISGYILTLP